MKRLLLLLVLALPLAAAEVDPPVAWSDQRVALRATVNWSYTCEPDAVSAAVAGNVITITIVAPVRTECQLLLPVVTSATVTQTVGPLAPGVYDVRARVVAGSSTSNDFVRTLHVRDAGAPFVALPQALVATMDEVELRRVDGRNFCAAQTPCAPVVTIDGRAASIVRRDDTRLVVRVPSALADGTFDVVVKEGETTSISRAAVTNARTGAVPAALLEPILIPVFFHGPGALGSQWTTDVWFRNENLFNVMPTNHWFSDCVLVIDPCLGFPLEWDHAVHRSAATGAQYPSGLRLFVPRGAADGLKATALVRDLTRQSEAAGAELPIARERDFANDITLVRVPVDARFRTALRIYGTRGGTVTLRIYAIRETETLSSEELVVNTAFNLQGSNDPSVPPVAVFTDLLAQFPRLRDLRVERTRISVTSSDRIWAFASVTNNATQHVTNIRPQ